MDAKELRVGNWVENDIGNMVLIDRETLPFVVTKWIKCHHPVNLTEDILLKCGFEWENHGLRLNDICIRKEVGGFVVYTSNESFNFKIELKNLHQLQNLYFALTGEELKIKL